MHGLKIDKAVPDEISKDDLPYMEMIYRFVFGERSYYDLSSTRHFRATSYERGGGGGGNDRPTRPIEDRATGDTIRQSVVCDVTFRERASSSDNLIRDYPKATGTSCKGFDP